MTYEHDEILNANNKISQNIMKNNFVANKNKSLEESEGNNLREINKQRNLVNQLNDYSKNENNLNNNNNDKIPTLTKLDINKLKDIGTNNTTLNICSLLLPNFMYCGNSKEIAVYAKKLDYLNEELDIAILINKVNQLEKLKNCIFNKDQILVFNYLYQARVDEDCFENGSITKSKSKHSIEHNEFCQAFEKIKGKEEKDNIDAFLVGIFI